MKSVSFSSHDIIPIQKNLKILSSYKSMDPAFSHDAFPLNSKLAFNLFGENLIFWKILGVDIHFCFIF